MNKTYPRIRTPFDNEPSQEGFYTAAIERILGHILPPHFFEEEDVVSLLHAKLPFICWTPLREPPFDLSIFLWCHFRANAFRFFYEMVSRWLIPGRRLNALLQFATDFTMPDLSSEKYIAGEVIVRIETGKELEILQKNLPIIESEISVGVASYYQACRILEIKGLTSDEKTALIQENIVALIKHRPQDFDYDILSEMQHFLVLCKEEFKHNRSWRHMSRVICVHYLFRKAMRFSLEVYPNRRYISVKLIRATLPSRKKVLGITLALSFLRDHECFDAGHIRRGIQALIPEAKLVEGSFFRNESRSDPTIAIYLEIEKEGGISLEEERLLKEELPSELKSRIEQRLNPIFMPQNEEVIMRYIVALSAQLKYVRDLPQVIIDFIQQTEEHLEFLVVALRVVTPNLKSIASLFKAKPSTVEFFPDRTKSVGRLRKKYKKEASVFRLKIRKVPFLRTDHSVDLYKARQEIAKELARIIGEFRDYNGGTISKETELFEHLRHELGKYAHEKDFLLENFFYSLSPPVMRSVLPVKPLKKLFLMILEGESEELLDDLPYQIRIQSDSNNFYMMLTAKDGGFREVIQPILEPFKEKIATSFIHQADYPCLGMIFRDFEPEEALRIRLSVEQALTGLK